METVQADLEKTPPDDVKEPRCEFKRGWNRCVLAEMYEHSIMLGRCKCTDSSGTEVSDWHKCSIRKKHYEQVIQKCRNILQKDYGEK